MVVLKASKAEGTFLGQGTHVWLVIESGDEKVSFSGAKAGKILRVYKNYKRDHNRDGERGKIVILPPSEMSDEEWAKAVMSAGDEVMDRLDSHYVFNGIWPHGRNRSGQDRANCGTIVSLIIEQAGGVIPKSRLRGFVPGLVMS